MGIANLRNNRIGGVDTDMKDFAQLAQDDLDRADARPADQADYLLRRAGVYALLSIAQEISKMPSNMPEYLVNFDRDE